MKITKRNLRPVVLLPIWWPIMLIGIVLYLVSTAIGYGMKDARRAWRSLS